MNTPRPTFLGFLAKRVAPKSSWLKSAAVEAIGSVSECISSGPADRIDHWKHNDPGLYDSEELAWAVVPSGERDGHTLFAYRVYPLRFDEDQPDEAWDPAVAWSELPHEPDLSAFERIGFDLVGKSQSAMFDCSPLSCNGVAAEYEVNRWCLIDDFEQAVAAGRAFGQRDSGVEPAAYHLVEVLRRR